MRLLQKIWLSIIVGAACLLGVVFAFVHTFQIDFSVLEFYNADRPSVLLDDEGNEWGRFQLDRREPIKLEQLPPRVIQAFIAAEDWEFFSHSGISVRGIVRSVLVNLWRGRKAQGASTITQQLVRLLFFDTQKTFQRKIKEQLYAIMVERQCTKEYILEMYLNHIYFGFGIYGVEAACQRFWGKHVNEISVDEAAVLAATVCSPGIYCPLINPHMTQKRRDLILGQMLKLHYITDHECAQARSKPITLREDRNQCAPHLKESIRIFLEELVGKQELYTGGLVIQTTLSQQVQITAEKVFNQHVKQLNATILKDADGALITLDAKTGEIKALIGGKDFSKSKFNRALQARRQMGSIFKPLIYASALDSGMSFADTEIDEPLELIVNGTPWSPHNHDQEFQGPVTLAYALSYSNNIVAIKTLLKVGGDKVLSLAKKAGLQVPTYSYPALGLGCIDATALEAVGMFNVFANEGCYVEPHYLRWVKDGLGKKIWKSSSESRLVISSRVNGQMVKALGLSLKRWHDMLDCPWVQGEVISKTGTTNDSRVCWYVGSTPDLTSVVCIGYDDNRAMGKDIYPVKTSFPIWMGLHSALPLKQKQFTYDPSLREMLIHDRSGRQLSGATDEHAITILV